MVNRGFARWMETPEESTTPAFATIGTVETDGFQLEDVAPKDEAPLKKRSKHKGKKKHRRSDVNVDDAAKLVKDMSLE